MEFDLFFKHDFTRKVGKITIDCPDLAKITKEGHLDFSPTYLCDADGEYELKSVSLVLRGDRT